MPLIDAPERRKAVAGGRRIDVRLARPLLNRAVLHLAQLEHCVWADLRPEQFRAGLIVFYHPVNWLLWWLWHRGSSRNALVAVVLLQAR